MAYETVMEDEVEQIIGLVHVGDFGSVGPRHVALFNITGIYFSTTSFRD